MPQQTPSGPSCTWVIYDLRRQGMGCSRSWCVLGSYWSRTLLSYLLLGSQFAFLPSPLFLWRCFPFFSLLSSPSSLSSFSFSPLHFFPVFLCCSLSLFSSSCLFYPLHPCPRSITLLPFLPISPALLPLPEPEKGELGDLAHQEHTNTGFEYFLWWERRVREPLRSSTSVGPISNWYPLVLHKSWRELPKFAMTALAAQTSDFPLCWFRLEPKTTKIPRLSTPKQPGAGSMEGGHPQT